MKIAQQTISSLVDQLNSDDIESAKGAGERLDRLLYPRCPSVITGDQWVSISEAHYSSLRGSVTLEPLLRTLVEGSDYAREYAATVLGAIKEPRAISLLLTALDDPCPRVRESATKGLWFFRDTSTVFPLVDRLQDSTSSVRHGAADALGFIGSSDAVPSLIKLYETGDREDMLAALYALGNIADPRALPLARKALNHPHKRVRNAAKSVLATHDFNRRKQSEKADAGNRDEPAADS
jgi:HEAT repeat protein